MLLAFFPTKISSAVPERTRFSFCQLKCIFCLPMKVVLQNKHTECFVGKENKWVSDVDEAIFSTDSIAAQTRCRQIKLQDIQIVIRTEIGHNIVLSCCKENCG